MLRPSRCSSSRPLVQNAVPLFRGADGVQHVAVALGVDRLLEGVDGQAQVHLVGGDEFPQGGQVGRLYAVKENQEGEDLVEGGPLVGAQGGGTLLYRSGG